MIIFSDKKVEVKWHWANREHYEDLGYTYTKQHNTLLVSSSEVNPSSSKEVFVICPSCKEERKAQRASLNRNNSSMCQACANIESRYKDISNERFGRLAALENTWKKSSNGKYLWLCKCNCGILVCVRSDSLKNGNTQSCGCLAREAASESMKRISEIYSGENSPNFIDISEKEFGRLIPLEYLGDGDWLCNCKCGNAHITKGEYIREGKTRSCGCLRDDKMSGENNHRWNPDLSDDDRQDSRTTEEYRDFVKSILERDDYTCQICGDKGGLMNAHHLYSYADYLEYRLDPSNCLTLCYDQHREFHNWMGGTIIPCTPKDFFNWLSEENLNLTNPNRL